MFLAPSSDNKKHRREIVYRDLEKQILSGSLLPGSRLVESTLAKKLQVSQTIIREVLQQLELEGFPRIIPNKGTEVVRLSVKDIEEILDIQTALEGLAAVLAARKISAKVSS